MNARFWPVVVSSFLLGGCVGTQIVPPDTNLRAMTQIRVVAMESEPLWISQSPKVASAVATSPPSNNGSAVPFPPVPTPLVGAQIGGIINIVRVVAELSNPEGDKQLARFSESATALLIPNARWVPINVMTQAAEAQLIAGGWATTRSSTLQLLPSIGSREVTKWRLNWDTAFLHWYNADSSEYDYSAHEVKTGETILEVALAYYFAVDSLLFHSYLKVVEPSARKVIGRTYEFESIRLNDAQIRTMFSDNGQSFEELFSATGQRLIQKGLSSLKLMLRPKRN